MTRKRGALAATRLESLDAEAVAREVTLQVAAHAEAVSALLGAKFVLAKGQSSLERQVAAVVRFAQTGEASDESHALLEALAPLRSTPTGSSQDVEELDIHASDWNLALVGAHARMKLAKNKPVTGRDLATLASLTATSIHIFTRSGELVVINEGRPALYDARSSRKWLIERGVQGLTSRRS